MKSFFQFLKKNKLYTFIEVFGLAVAIGFIILLASYANTEYNVGNKQSKSKELYAVGTGEFIGMTLETIPTFAPSIPEITGYTRIEANASYDAIIGENFLQMKGMGIDTNFFNVFDYHLYGVSKNQILRSKNEMLLSESFARKAFGGENPVGKSIKVSNDRSFTVIGTFEDFGPYDLYENVDFMYSIKNSRNSAMDQFGNTQTFITLAEGVEPDIVSAKLLDKYTEYWEGYGKDGSTGSFLWGSTLTRYDEIYFSPLQKFDTMRSGNSRQVWILLIVGLVLLISAIFNYINLTVAQTGKRAKEMATRRLLGSSPAMVIWRYLSESSIFTLGCFVVGFVLAFYFRPLFERILQTQIAFSYDAATICVIAVAIVVISVISGLMPSLLVAKYKPIDVVKGNFSFHSKMRLGRIFIMLQSLISVIITSVALAMMLQIHHLTTLPMGYNTKNLIKIETRSAIHGSSYHKILRERILTLPQVKQVALCGQLPSMCGFNGVPLESGNMVFLAMPTLDSLSFQMYGFKVLEQFSDLTAGKIWLTREAQRLFNVDANNPKIGTDGRYEICGIIEDYISRDAVFEPMTNSYNSVRMIDDSYEWLGNLLVEITGDQDAAIKAIREECDKVVKELTGLPKQLDVSYLKDYFYNQLKGKRDTMSLVIAFMIVSVLISALGLLAMSVYYTEQQSRQIAIRKIYGSTTKQITRRLTSNFLILSSIAVVISIPISIYLIRTYLEDFTFRISFPIAGLILSCIFSLLIAYISVYGSSHTAALRNPVDTINQ